WKAAKAPLLKGSRTGRRATRTSGRRGRGRPSRKGCSGDVEPRRAETSRRCRAANKVLDRPGEGTVRVASPGRKAGSPRAASRDGGSNGFERNRLTAASAAG